jgi:hypothetical protein
MLFRVSLAGAVSPGRDLAYQSNLHMPFSPLYLPLFLSLSLSLSLSCANCRTRFSCVRFTHIYCSSALITKAYLYHWKGHLRPLHRP